MIEKFQFLLLVLSFGAILVSVPVFSRMEGWLNGNAVKAVLLFGGLFYLEFYIFGSASFIDLDDEGDFTNPIFNYVVNAGAGEIYTHRFAGGNDLYAIGLSSKTLFSFEQIWFSLFPHWIAVLIHKISIFGIAVAGAYLVARETAQCRKGTAVAIGLLFASFYLRHVDHTIIHGMGRSIFPLAVYVCVCRINKPHYFLGVLLLSVLTMTTTPTHAFLGLLTSVVFGAVILGKFRPARLAGALAILVLAEIANWHEVIYAMTKVLPYTTRGQEEVMTQWGIIEAAKLAINRVLTYPIPVSISIAGLVYLAAIRDRFWIKGALALGGMVVGLVLVRAFPWQGVGLGPVGGLSLHYILEATNFLAVPVMARTALQLERRVLPENRRSRFANPAGVTLAAAFGCLIWFKGEHLFQYVYYGGQSQFHTIDNLNNTDWATKEPFRVITIRHRRPEPGIVAGFYGLDTYDASVNLAPSSLIAYWHDGIKKGNREYESMPRVMLDFRFWDEEKRSLDVGEYLNLNLLGIANVAYIISPVPLHGGGVVRVSGPDDDTYSILRGLTTRQEISGFLGHRLRKILNFGKVYIYQLPKVLPRVYAARSVSILKDGVDKKALLGKIDGDAMDRDVVVSPEDAGALKIASSAVDILSFRLVENGVDVELAPGPDGVVVVNIPHLPFWKARADGKPVSVVPANLVQMAVSVPAGTRSLKLRYERVLLRDRLAAIF